jgi:hypothetical protein
MLLEDYATLIPNEVSPTHSPARAWHAYKLAAAQWSFVIHDMKMFCRAAEANNQKLEHYETTHPRTSGISETLLSIMDLQQKFNTCI